MKLSFSFLVLALMSLNLAQGLEISVDTSNAPDLAPVGQRIKDTLLRYYPELAYMLRSPSFQPLQRLFISFGNLPPNVRASSLGDRITGNLSYFRSESVNEGLKVMIHELTHGVQQYGIKNLPQDTCNKWITEGIADWVKYYRFDTSWQPGKPWRGSSYREDNAHAAYFLNWLESRYWTIIFQVNHACREGTYAGRIESIFPVLTGKTVDQLWTEMLNS